MPLLEVRGVSLRYADDLVLRDVSFDVEQGEIFALLGPSGCGKTSILRVLAGLETAEAGSATFAGQSIDAVPPHKRGFGLMFQEYALFPHLNVAGNVEFGLRMQRLSSAARRRRVAELLDLVGLAGFGPRRIHELSGGERQRVALARSLAPSPRLLMLDEPLGSLDRALRDALLLELRAILTRLGQTSVYVTHDQDEAFALADRVLIMDRGTVRQIGRPEAIFAAPADAFVARFLGLVNLVDAEIQTRADGRYVAVTPLGEFWLPPAAVAGLQPALGGDGHATLLLGDEQACLHTIGGAAPAVAPNQFVATVTQRSFRGRRLTFRLDASDAELLIDVDVRPEHRGVAVGERVLVTIDPAWIRVLP